MNPFKNRKGLGRGLSSLMGDTDNGQSTASINLSETKISIAKLRPSPLQPRRIFDKNTINELAESIQSKGLVQPILVSVAQPCHNPVGIHMMWVLVWALD